MQAALSKLVGLLVTHFSLNFWKRVLPLVQGKTTIMNTFVQCPLLFMTALVKGKFCLLGTISLVLSRHHEFFCTVTTFNSQLLYYNSQVPRRSDYHCNHLSIEATVRWLMGGCFRQVWQYCAVTYFMTLSILAFRSKRHPPVQQPFLWLNCIDINSRHVFIIMLLPQLPII